MVRRLQLLEPEHRPPAGRVAALVARIRDSVLRDNRVIPGVLGVLALLVFAWLIAGVLIGDSGKEEQQASNQAALSQAPEEDSAGGRPETPAPEVENRDADSFAVFEPKDPFRELVPPKDNESTNAQARVGNGGGGNDRGSTARSDNGNDRNRTTGGGSRGGSSPGGRSADDGEDFIEQTSPRENRDLGANSGGEGSDRASGQNAGQDGTANLFGSGGDLPPP